MSFGNFSMPVSPSGTPTSVQFSSVAQSCPTLCDPMNCSTPGLLVHHQLWEFTQDRCKSKDLKIVKCFFSRKHTVILYILCPANILFFCFEFYKEEFHDKCNLKLPSPSQHWY